MSYQASDAYVGEFCTQAFATGIATNADSLPTATANKNGTDDAAFVLTCANIDTGRYKITGTVPVGYVAGDVVNISVAATVLTVGGKGVVDSFVVDTRVKTIVNASNQVVAASVVADVGITQAGADKVWGTASRTLSAFGFTVSITLSAANILAIWNQLTADAGIIAGSFAKFLKDNLPSAAAPTVAQIDTQLSATHGAGLWTDASGSGFYTVEIPCEVSGVPADGVQVQVTNDITGLNIVAQATSDTNGTATVFLDAGTYYAWLQRGGDTFPNPTQITVP